MFYRIKKQWIAFWMRFGKHSAFGKLSTWMAVLLAGSYKHRYPLAALYPHGFTAPDAAICKTGLLRGNFVYIGSRVKIFRKESADDIRLAHRVHINDSTCFEVSAGGSIDIGEETYIQSGCQLSAYVGRISIGKRVQIAPGCSFYPYNHGMSRDQSMKLQPLVSKGGIVVKDEAWIGCGAIILDGVTIGTGAVIGAGSVVNQDIPDYAIAAGNPAKVIKMRE